MAEEEKPVTLTQKEAQTVMDAFDKVMHSNHHPHCAMQDGCHIEDAISEAIAILKAKGVRMK